MAKRVLVPVELLTPLIERWEMEVATTAGGQRDNNYCVELLRQKTGLSDEMVWKVRHAKKKSVSFETADMILCALGNPARLWRTAALRPYYFEGCEPPDESKPIKCERPGCDKWFEYDSMMKRRKYCSASCNSYASDIRSGRAHKGKRTRWGNRWGSGVVGRQKKVGEFSCGHPKSLENIGTYYSRTRDKTYERCLECHRTRERERAARV